MSDVDLDKYRRHVDRFHLSEEKKTELLKAVWRIMQSFVDRAFGDDPVQHCLQIEGQSRGTARSGETPDGDNLGGRAIETALAATDLAAKNLAEAALAEDSLDANDASDSSPVIASKTTTTTETQKDPVGSLRNKCETDGGKRK